MALYFKKHSYEPVPCNLLSATTKSVVAGLISPSVWCSSSEGFSSIRASDTVVEAALGAKKCQDLQSSSL